MRVLFSALEIGFFLIKGFMFISKSGGLGLGNSSVGALLKPMISGLREDNNGRHYIYTAARNMAPLPRSQKDLHQVAAIEKKPHDLANNE